MVVVLVVHSKFVFVKENFFSILKKKWSIVNKQTKQNKQTDDRSIFFFLLRLLHDRSLALLPLPLRLSLLLLLLGYSFCRTKSPSPSPFLFFRRVLDILLLQKKITYFCHFLEHSKLISTFPRERLKNWRIAYFCQFLE